MKARLCKVCRSEYTPRRMGQKVCSPLCAQALAKSKRVKEERRALIEKAKRDKERLKTRSQWLKEAQMQFNAWIRARDAHLPCVSCGRYHEGQFQAGHYLSVGARPELRFEPDNVWKQCAPCNNHLSGNAVLYRKELINRIGLERVEWLEGPHEPKKYTVDELKAIKAECKAKVKELMSAN